MFSQSQVVMVTLSVSLLVGSISSAPRGDMFLQLLQSEVDPKENEVSRFCAVKCNVSVRKIKYGCLKKIISLLSSRIFLDYSCWSIFPSQWLQRRKKSLQALMILMFVMKWSVSFPSLSENEKQAAGISTGRPLPLVSSYAFLLWLKELKGSTLNLDYNTCYAIIV